MGFLVQKDSTAQYVSNGTQPDGRITMNAGPGTIPQLPKGMEFQGWDPQHPTAAYAEFSLQIERHIASGLDVSYTSLANDLRAVNFSSIRAGLLDEREIYRMLQQHMITRCMIPIFLKWFDMAQLMGQLDVPGDADDYEDYVDFTPRGWPWVDPLKDQQAAQMGIQNTTTTLTESLANQGKDLIDVLEERRAELDLLTQYNIPSGTDAKGVADAPEDVQEGDSAQKPNAEDN